MTFGQRNAYYLRISTNAVLPLFLYLDERHIDWMSDVVLQHVLSDLRPLVIPKLQAEKDVHFGSGAAPGTKRGTVEVHRGESYQFAYFFRKTEPHTVLFKSRYFVTAPFRSGVVPNSASPEPVDRSSQDKRSRTQESVKQSKRKRGKTKGKGTFPPNRLDKDEWTAEIEESMDDADPIPREPRPVRKQRRIITDVYQEGDGDDEDVVLQDVAMKSSPFVNDGDAAAWVVDDQLSRSSPDTADIELIVEEEEEKPKPLFKLKYQSFSISGHCLCVVVEPWSPQRAEAKLRSVGLGTSISLKQSLRPSNDSVIGGQRAKTPLFFPDNDRVPMEMEIPFARERSLSSVPLFPDAMSGTEDDVHSDDDLMSFSQTLNAAGHMHAIAADDDDDIDGAVLFGDADEIRELL